VSVTPEFRTFIRDQLGRTVQGVRDRAMFGGIGIYAGDLFFALIDDDTLYLKVDDTNRDDFVSLGLGPFRPFGPDGETMQYYEVPADLLDDADALGVWADKAIDVARRSRRTNRKRPRGK
jgi:DNA transformation protein